MVVLGLDYVGELVEGLGYFVFWYGFEFVLGFFIVLILFGIGIFFFSC